MVKNLTSLDQTRSPSGKFGQLGLANQTFKICQMSDVRWRLMSDSKSKSEIGFD